MLQRRKLQKRDCLGKIHLYNILKRETDLVNKGHVFHHIPIKTGSLLQAHMIGDWDEKFLAPKGDRLND